MTDGVCTSIGSEMWTDPEDLAMARVAKALCRSCPVLPECLDFYLETGGIQVGVAAGLTARERTKAIADRNRLLR